ncbi:ATP-binding protein [Mycobacterium parmense]|uniref:Histidine kinase/HSP90-like ATPase domain-containing protein n=1 Tax=Mycobacterium parmense TaxID=185642 RepID=A0A7I7YN14_9MYCO|nr:ATP-binding protein [Mycobacterium parmense]MCV7353256.1 ATP-binding protein [Mycobacterium parmense]ORW61561.1 hypothetical protein AWC20_05895 [Mycobacterium parmense]BBZ43268.1 hypothetical protein MPRM_05490 [Mycobacterium parmense]
MSDLHAAAVPARTYRGPADAGTVALFRRHFRDWLDAHFLLDATRVSDIILGTDEALSNCAEHAYRNRGGRGDMVLDIAYDHQDAAIAVCVTDTGCWIEPDPTASQGLRGRGLILMNALADECTVDGRDDGTTVCLRYHQYLTRHRGIKAS